MKLLLVEDDSELCSYIQKGLEESLHIVDCAVDGKEGLFLATTNEYDVLIIDRMLPELDGLRIVQTLRASENHTPILLISALGEVDDKVKGLRVGGDDYLVKPFAFTELLARVEVLARRKHYVQQVTELQVADLKVDLLGHKVWRASEEIALQTREFNLLVYLLKHKGQVITRTILLEAVWDYHFDPQTNVIDVHISRLRKKIGDTNNQLIKTVRGAGYIIEDNI